MKQSRQTIFLISANCILNIIRISAIILPGIRDGKSVPLNTPRRPILYPKYPQSRPPIFPDLLFQLKLMLHDIPYLFCINFLNRPDPVFPFRINRIFDLHGTVGFHRFPILLSDHCMGGKLILIFVIQVTQYKKLYSMKTGIPLFLNILMCSQVRYLL